MFVAIVQPHCTISLLYAAIFLLRFGDSPLIKIARTYRLNLLEESNDGLLHSAVVLVEVVQFVH